MNDRIAYSRSSWLVARPVLGCCLVLAALAAFFGQSVPAWVLLFLAALGIVARVWASAAVSGLTLSVQEKPKGLFPGEQLTLTCAVKNKKKLPVLWLELFCPLAQNQCLLPQQSRTPDEWEQAALQEAGADTEQAGEYRHGLILPGETALITTQWTAQRRGVYTTALWKLRTGDGLGLAQIERPLAARAVRRIPVYPQLVPVSPAIFLRNQWNADAGARGTMEDPTVIRSTRGYLDSDPARRINWRLAARGQPLTVNVYETILPRSVHFILDGESFFGYSEDLEETLRILASLFLQLNAHQVHCGLSLGAGAAGPARNIFSAPEPWPLLEALAAYQPAAPLWDEEAGRHIAPPARFLSQPIYEAGHHIGRFYYISRSTDTLAAQPLPHRLGAERLSLILWENCPGWGDFEAIPLETLREEAAHG